ncbi:photosystem II 12 kDa extrinsic protein [Microcystis phage MaAM05]|nr:photosystem II 12 kDa extrinsic protein [Microcystis phage MaAM05]
MGMLLLLLPGVFWISPALAATFWDTYVPPELAFQDDLRQTIALPQRININQDSLNQLKVLPGLNEDIALKVMRNRPYTDVQDFYRKLPGLDKKRIDRLIQQIQPKIKFQ